MDAPADSGHLVGTGAIELCARLLVGVDPEGPEEAGDPEDPGPGVAHAEQQVPVNGEAKLLADAGAGRLPGAATPEEGLLRNEVRPGKDRVAVARQHPAADLHVVLV